MSTRTTSGGDSWTPLFEPLTRLRGAWPQHGWSWDGRVSCVSSSFNVELDAKTRAAARASLPHEWGANDIAAAPPDVRKIADGSGGLRTGQFILAAPPVNGIIAFGLWWPWGDGTTTSFRVGLSDCDGRESLLSRLRTLFGVVL